MWCIPKVDEDFVQHMEDVLETYEREPSVAEPVVCVDEKPVQLVSDARPPLLLGPGHPKRRDYEYVRGGTVNIFAIVEPKRGKHWNRVTPTRTGKEFATVLDFISKTHRRAKKIHLVLGNLSTHSWRSVIPAFGIERALNLKERFLFHYTPKHASWLNQAEMELSLISREALGKDRIDRIEELSRRIELWNEESNKASRTIAWSFTRRRARRKFHYSLKTMRSRY